MSDHRQPAGRRPVQNGQRRLVVARYAARRAALKAISSFPRPSDEERAAPQREARRQPRDADTTHPRTRDAVAGRPRGRLRAFGLTRIRARDGTRERTARRHRGS
ncbi:hypothetical protein SCATT_p17020 (plasmid) [Streptantibioticus cattleyicolor NRRL 8057 = DSM 46488]|uniref:Uncharacterized protein n=1 Tax=Streptantibioticus cattleyicolor (strain ATCC 35852 / DSM 46488 / JCM 4925 / NBRC 14057 / NRRL 8057) TaxID=1003195 RepID=F8JJQ6_STREN|nr:hypothetical protein SCATT_p17020 [Streptantibioticus cattleyicolor NRRL 8057 = DSM 46488]CCB71070.1 protein of unknown function [Streptantibioticus cattleyicolor NRRL 8057 = DSM 46488]